MKSILIGLGLVLTAAPLAAQVAVSGVVREDGSDRPLAGVEVLIEGSKRTSTTDSAGRFVLDAPTGTKVALFRSIGFRPFRLRLQLARGDPVTANADLVREGVRLDSISVTGSVPRPRGTGLEGFEERRRMGFGQFYDSTFLRRMEHRRLMEVIQGTPGLRFVKFSEDPSRPWIYELRLTGIRRESFDGVPCWMSVIFDGSPIYRSGSSVGRPPDFRRELTAVSHIQAIEVYRSASEVPLEYGGSSNDCGLLLLWSRRGT